MSDPVPIDFIYFDAGGGHRSAATALKLVAEQQQRPWDIRMVNLQEVLEPLDVVKRATGLRLQDTYNRLVTRGWTLGAPQLLKGLHGLIRAMHGPAVKLLAKHWNETRPALVVSLVPNFNRTMYAGLRAANPRTPYVTILTDLADYPPHFWIERKQEQFFVCGSTRAVEQARELGHAPERIFRASGMILHPRFYEPPPFPTKAGRAAERAKLGLRADLPTGLMLFGGQGSPVMKDIVEQLDKSRLDVQLIAICGKNDKVAAALRKRKGRIPLFVEGFTKEVPYYMALSDFFIGKPGPGSISEALAMNLPVIVERNVATLPQERFNCEFVTQNGFGLVVKNFRRDITAAVRRLLEPQRLAETRAAMARYENRAVFEIPGFLEKILATADACR